MSRRSHFSGFGSAVTNHKLWQRAKEIEAQRRAEKEAKEKSDANQSPTNKKPADAETPTGAI